MRRFGVGHVPEDRQKMGLVTSFAAKENAILGYHHDEAYNKTIEMDETFMIKDCSSKMKDYDGRPLEITALYHKQFESPSKKPRTGPQYWNFLEMHLDPRDNGNVQFKIRNLIDAPKDQPRGGGSAKIPLQSTGRPITSQLPEIKTLPNAEVRFATIQGRPIRGTRSTVNGTISLKGLVDVEPATKVLMTAIGDSKVDAQVLTTLPIAEG